MPISKWVDQKTMVHLHNGILCSRKKEWPPTLCDSMDGTGEHYTKWNKPGGKRQIAYDLTFNRNLINTMNKQAKYSKDIEIENRLTVTEGERGGDKGGKGKKPYLNNNKKC